MDFLTDSIRRNKFDQLGGLKALYLFPYTRHSKSLITVSNQFLTAFPATDIFLVECVSLSYNEQPSEENGSIKFSQSLQFTVPHTESDSEIWKLLKQNYSAIYVDNLGNTRIVGLYNGAKVSYKNESGSSISDLNGYSVTMNAVETNQAYFIDDLTTLGFTIIDSEFLAQENGCLLLQENNFEILV
jgi:hypothetical protein